MTNPVAQIRKTCQSAKDAEGNYTDETEDLYTSVEVYCPGCKQRHQARIEVHQPAFKRPDGSDYPVWGWNGSLDSPTFTPSLLCYSTVHLCEGEHAPVTICDREFGECEHKGHGYVWVTPDGEQRFYKVYEYDQIPEGTTRHTFGGGAEDPHPRDPAWGNCHSFVKDGVWEFLSDCAHDLAGQSVPLPPLPDWMIRHDA